MAFQLKDDLLDVYGDEASFGKRIGGDILCNKKTYLLINALEKAKLTDKEELEFWLNNNPEQETEKIQAVTALYNKLNVKKICEDKMQFYLDKAIVHLDRVQVEEHKKLELQKLAEKLMSRDD